MEQDITRDELYDEEVIEDVADHREFNWAWWDELVYPDSARIEGHNITVIEGPHQISDKVSIIGLLCPDFGEPRFQGHSGISDHPLTLLLKHLQLVIHKLLQLLIVGRRLVNFVDGDFVVVVLALVSALPGFGIQVDDGVVVEVAPAFQKVHVADLL